MVMNWKGRFWKYVTAIVVVLILLNPETVHFAIFLDAVGLDIFLMLIEVQILAVIGAVLSYYFKPVQAYLKLICLHRAQTFSLSNFRELPRTLALVTPSQATIMHMLVFSAAIGIALNV